MRSKTITLSGPCESWSGNGDNLFLEILHTYLLFGINSAKFNLTLDRRYKNIDYRRAPLELNLLNLIAEISLPCE